MDPLNKKERTEAFIKMLLLFLLTVVIVAIPMYYAFQMPQKDKELSNKEFEEIKALIRSNNQNDQDFLLLADSAHALFNQYSKENIEVKRSRISDRFSAILNDMEDAALRIEKDTVRSDLYGHIIEAYSNLILKTDDINTLKAELKKAAEKAEGGEGGGGGSSKQLSGDDQQKQLIKSTLAKHNGNKKDAAKELGMTERKLKKKMEELGL